MKKICAFVLLGLCCLVGFSACEEEGTQEVTMTIASRKGVKYNISGIQIPTLIARTASSPDWRSMDDIEGFEFEEGYECTLRVGIIPIREPMADGSDRRYKMLFLISREYKDSEGLPPLMPAL